MSRKKKSGKYFNPNVNCKGLNRLWKKINGVKYLTGSSHTSRVAEVIQYYGYEVPRIEHDRVELVNQIIFNRALAGMPDWHRFIAAQLRQLAYIGEGMAAHDEGTETAPVVSISLFEDSRISVIDNDDMIQTEEQLKWIEEQLMHGVDEIRKKLNLA